MTAVVGWDHAESIDDVLERMASIEATLPHDDGVAYFNRMYSEVTRLVSLAVDGQSFEAGEFLERLDVHFANLFFEAYAADLAGTEISPAWAPLFEGRKRENTHPVQFALAGMNAHICHDLPIAVIHTCQEIAVRRSAAHPAQRLHPHQRRARRRAGGDQLWFSSGAVATVDRLAGRVDDGFAAFGIHVARAAAWTTSEILWGLTDNPRLNDLFRGGLRRTVELTSRGILL